ncbi:MAG TPA: hypothetical protein VF771_00470 [Longimicrobiaceae bacterium]
MVPVLVVASLVFGYAWTAMFWRSMRRMSARIHSGDPAIVPPPPAGAYDWRVMCSWLRSPRVAVGGHLYAGQREWTFVPHRRNLRAHQELFTITPGPDTRVEAVETPARGLVRLFATGPLKRLRIANPHGEWLFILPETEYVAEQLGVVLRGGGAGEGLLPR